tara:strand:- start:1546 stop:1782 length:237 start_codon:yes stop_codon:yes gene_type:complete
MSQKIINPYDDYYRDKYLEVKDQNFDNYERVAFCISQMKYIIDVIENNSIHKSEIINESNIVLNKLKEIENEFTKKIS